MNVQSQTNDTAIQMCTTLNLLATTAALVLAWAAPPAWGQNSASPTPTVSPEGHGTVVDLTVGGGVYNASRPGAKETEFRLEYRSKQNILFIKPLAGALYTDKKSFHIYGGFEVRAYLSRHLDLSPSFAAGFYKRGIGVNLGFPVEFRSGFELGWQISDDHRVACGILHTSNARLGPTNPGSESLIFNVTFPLSLQRPAAGTRQTADHQEALPKSRERTDSGFSPGSVTLTTPSSL